MRKPIFIVINEDNNEKNNKKTFTNKYRKCFSTTSSPIIKNYVLIDCYKTIN